jgi:signal peptidase I
MNAPEEHGSGLRGLLWIALIPLLGGLVYLGLIVALGTTTPFEATVGRSMEPTLHTGDLAVMQGVTPSTLRLGDIVAIRVHEGNRAEFGYPETVLHRVIDIRLDDRGLVVQTQGDNQPAPDPFVTPASDVKGRMTASVPGLGYALFYLKSPQGKIAIVGLILLFLLYEGVRWATDTAEELIEEPVPVEAFVREPSGDFAGLTHAIQEYGTHLRSHTRVVMELGDTTEELRRATQMQREVLGDLGGAVRSLAQRLESPLAASGAVPLAAPAAARSPEVEREQPAAQGIDVRVLASDFPRVELVARGLEGQAALLAFGAALEAMPGAVNVALEAVDEGGARFSLETLHAGEFLERLRAIEGFEVVVRHGARDEAT